METKSPQEIFDSIATAQDPIEGLQMPTIESFLTRCLAAFPSAQRERNGDHEWVVLDRALSRLPGEGSAPSLVMISEREKAPASVRVGSNGPTQTAGG